MHCGHGWTLESLTHDGKPVFDKASHQCPVCKLDGARINGSREAFDPDYLVVWNESEGNFHGSEHAK